MANWRTKKKEKETLANTTKEVVDIKSDTTPAAPVQTSAPQPPAAEAASKPYGQRTSRTPLANRMNLEASYQEPGFVYRTVNDKGGRVEMLQRSGWEIVTDPNIKLGAKMVEGSKIPGSAITKPVGNGVIGVLMRKPEDWHNEDMKPVYDKAKRVEDTLYGKNRDDGFENHGTEARTSLGNLTK